MKRMLVNISEVSRGYVPLMLIINHELVTRLQNISPMLTGNPPVFAGQHGYPWEFLL